MTTAPRYHKTILDQGLRLVSEQVPGAASVALGIWAAAGSRDERLPDQGEENGLAHLVEHLVFKGTPGRDKLAIAREIDRQGGQANAYTTKEHTCFHTRVRPEHLAGAVDLLVDIFQNSLYDEAELELEKQVIQQEIAMVDDEPEELAHDLAAAAIWPGHPLGRPVAGTADSVDGLSRAGLLDWLGRHYVGPRLVVSAAGAVEHERLAEMVGARLRPRPEIAPREFSPPLTRPGLTVRRRKLEQAHLVLSGDFPDVLDRRRAAASVLNLALGGNMSSRLFQEIREKRGLAYSVYSNYSAYQDIGVMEIYAGAAPEKMPEVRDLILAEQERLRREPLTPTELEEAVSGLKTGLILNSESLDSRMSRLARNELTFGRHIDLAETCRELDAVTIEEVQALALEFWNRAQLSTCLLGPVKKSDFLN